MEDKSDGRIAATVFDSGQLSRGMQQRVGLALALAIADGPAVLLMVGPFLALEPLIRQQLQDRFRTLSAVMHQTTLFITHLEEAFRVVDRIAIIEDGVLAQTAKPEYILANPTDGYVADSIARASKLQLVSAGRIMQPLDAYTRRIQPLDGMKKRHIVAALDLTRDDIREPIPRSKCPHPWHPGAAS